MPELYMIGRQWRIRGGFRVSVRFCYSLWQYLPVRVATGAGAGHAIAFAVNNRQPKASGATMDEFTTDGPEGGVLAGLLGDPREAEAAGDAPAVAFHDTSEPLDFPVDYEHSGDRRVDDALDRLARLPDTPLPGHADVYDAVHTELRAILSEQPAGPR